MDVHADQGVPAKVAAPTKLLSSGMRKVCRPAWKYCPEKVGKMFVPPPS